ncbi:MAG TPA: LysR family transcriptional regulator [Candidatus Acidoferrum sp.]|nr:LysR family transcriptional regulator [Candidatus Acidoferrum sp.]
MVGRTGITYHQLRTFLAVARSGSLTKAARELNATQPTVSLQLRALRGFLGTPLFERPGGRFRLTHAGERLRRYAEDTVGGLRSLQQDVATVKGTLAGPLAVGTTFVISRYVLPSILSRFLEQAPGIELQLYVEFPEPVFRGLLANSLDVACYINVPVPPGLTVERLCDEEFVIFVSPNHPLARRRLVAPAELSREPFIASVSAPLRALTDAKLRAAGVTPRVMAEARHHDAIKKMVEHDTGYAMLIRSSVADELAGGRLVAVKLDGAPILAELVAAYRSRPAVSPLVREFVDFIRVELNRRNASAGEPQKRPTMRRKPRGRR